MNREDARRVLGLRAEATGEEAQFAFALIRTHLEARAAATTDPRERAACLGQAAALARALGIDLAPTPKRSHRQYGLMVGGFAAAAVAGAVAVFWWTQPASEPDMVATVAPKTAPPAVTEPLAPARLSVEANLAGAIVELAADLENPFAADGNPVEIASGTTQIRVTHGDCPDDWTETLELVPGELLEVSAEVCRDTGWLIVRSNQAGDRLFLDGAPVGATGPRRHSVKPGSHRVRIEKPGFEPWETVARVSPATERVLRARLRRPTQAAETTPVSGPDIPGGSRGWHREVSELLRERYDSDLSGLIDTEAEVAAIPCGEWLSLERSYETGGLSVPMSRLYGFDGSRWVKDALGFDLRVRDDSYSRMRECGLQ